MSHMLPLSRVARLVGTTRSTIQQMIKHGELATFDGMVTLEEVMRVFPDARLEDDGEFRRVEEIKKKAFAKRVFERALPDREVLAERLFDLSSEFANAQAILVGYERIFDWLGEKLSDVADSGGPATVQSVTDLRRWLREQVQAAHDEAERGKAWLAQESVMRIMSARVTVQPSGHEFYVEGNDTLLEAALRAGISLNYGCSNGNCGDCRARLVSGQVTKVHPHDYVLKEADKASGTFLMCSYTAVSDVVIEASVAGAQDIPQQVISTKVKAVERINDKVAALHLITPRSQRLRFLAGQHVTLDTGGVTGEYYLASCPCEDRHLELHVRRDNRPFARKVFDDLGRENPVTVSGPQGEFVIRMESSRPVLFVAWEDGFAPVKSLVQHAMSLELAESMHLYWAADGTGHYQDNLCRSWADALDNMTYVPLSVSDGPAAVARAVLDRHPDLSGFDLYATGPEPFLQQLKEGAEARGLPPEGWRGEIVL